MSKAPAISTRRYRQPAGSGKTWLYLNIALATILILVGIVALFWLGQQSASRRAAESGPILVGQPAPDFSLSTINGDTVRLNDLKGKVVLVNLWATWCPPCKAEMPGINAFYERHRDAGLVVLAANEQEDLATVKAFIQANGFSFPVLLDSQSEVMTRYGVRGLPTSFIIDQKGIIRHIQTGAISEPELEAIMTSLLP